MAFNKGEVKMMMFKIIGCITGFAIPIAWAISMWFYKKKRNDKFENVAILLSFLFFLIGFIYCLIVDGVIGLLEILGVM